MKDTLFVVEEAGAGGVLDCAVWHGAEVLPLVAHFVDNRAAPIGGTGFRSLDQAQEQMRRTLDACARNPTGLRPESPGNAATSVRVVVRNPIEHSFGYQIDGSTDESVAGQVYETYRSALNALLALGRKNVKLRGETPRITRRGIDHAA